MVATSSTTRMRRARTEACEESRTRSPGPRPRARRPAPVWRGPGIADEQTDRRHLALACDRAREERAVIDTVHAHATRTGRRPGDDVDREPRRKRAHRRRAQPRDRRARVAVLRARDELARDAFVRERRDPPVDAGRRWRIAARVASPRAHGAQHGSPRAPHGHVPGNTTARRSSTSRLRATPGRYEPPTTASCAPTRAIGPPGARGSAASGRTAAARSPLR